jgi:nucleotide-binding universal stress UspA family protein
VKVSSRQFQGVDLDAILEECKKLETDLIVVGTHGHGALYNLLIGSMTADILKKAFCPVLVVPA